MGPHYFFLTWSELGAIVGIIVALMDLFIWLTHETITRPMEVANQSSQKSINALTRKVEGIGCNAPSDVTVNVDDDTATIEAS